MSSLVPGFEHDVFVSYATVDDVPTPNGWVTTFVELFRQLLSTEYGSRNPDRVWWDRSNIDEEASLTRQISEKVAKSACLVIILSRGYVESKWCRQELEAFLAAAKQHSFEDSRVFLIDIGNLLEADRPKALSDIRGRRFWVQPPTSELPEDRQKLAAPVPRPDHPQYIDFYNGVDELARDVFRHVRKLSTVVPVPVASPAPSPIPQPPTSPPSEPAAISPAVPLVQETPAEQPVPPVTINPVIPPVRGSYNWDNGDFPVTVFVACKSATDDARIRRIAEALPKEVPVFNCSSNDLLSAGHQEQFRFEFRSVPHATLLDETQKFLSQTDSRFLIVVSDILSDGSSQTNAMQIRTLFREIPEYYCGLIAVTEGTSARVRDIDRVLDSRILAESLFLRELSRTADGLRLKAPPAKLIEPIEPVMVRLVQTKEEMRKCLHLRHLIYNRMHYLGDEIAEHPSELELDCFDLFDAQSGTGAIHFVAWSSTMGEVVGTARLIVPREVEFSDAECVLGNPPEAFLRRQAGFIRDIVAESDSGEVLRKAVLKKSFNRLPVLQSADQLDKSLLRGIGLAEISRVIVAPRFRGCGVGQLLVRALVAASIDLRKPNVVLECIPSHVGMYEKFGFELISGAKGRDENLDQEAVAMILQQGGPMVRAQGIAKNDLKMIRRGTATGLSLADKGFLCLCTARNCWEEGHYDQREHQSCPLRQLHGAGQVTVQNLTQPKSP